MLTREQIIQILRDNKTYLQNRFGLESLVLFGSYGRGDQHEESDIDFLYELPQQSSMPLLRLVRLEEYIGQILHIKKVEMVRKKYIEPIIYNQIKNQGIAIF